MRFLTVWRLGEDLARDRRPPAQGFCHLPRDGYQCLMSCSWFDLCPPPDVNIHGQPLRPRCYSCITWNTQWGPPQPKTQFPWNVGRLNNSQFTTVAGGKRFHCKKNACRVSWTIFHEFRQIGVRCAFRFQDSLFSNTVCLLSKQKTVFEKKESWKRHAAFTYKTSCMKQYYELHNRDGRLSWILCSFFFRAW